MSARGSFSGKVGFLLAAAGSAIGLGTIWRFPYLVGQNGGAAFLVIYLACVFLVGFPVMVGEITIGRNAGTDVYGGYKKLGGGKWGYVGIFGIIAAILILSFYNVVAGWAFGYFLKISFGDLVTQSNYRGFFGDFVNDVTTNFWLSLSFMIMTTFIVSQGIQKGIEAANKIMMPALFLILIGLIIYSLTLPNAFEGVRFYLVPNLSEITPQTIFDALRQAFFSLSLGLGGMMTYGSYLDKKQNIVSSSAVISIATTTVAFMAGLMIFPLVSALQAYDVQGPSLVFVVLAEVFHSMGSVVGRIVGGSFFLLLCFAALTSTISIMEVPVAYLVDQKKLSRKSVVWGMAVLIFVMGLPSMVSMGVVPALNSLSFYKGQDFLTFISDMADIFLTAGGCLMTLFITYRWKIDNLHNELSLGNERYGSSFVKKYLNFTIQYVCPLLTGIITILIVIDKFYGLEKLF